MAENEKNSKINKLLVTIAGQEFVIKGEESVEYIQSLADLVSEKMEIISSKKLNMAPQNIAVLTALNLADELKKTTTAYENLVKIIEEEKNI